MADRDRYYLDRKMSPNKVNEEQVETDFQTIARIRNIAWQRHPEDVMALSDRLCVQMMTDVMPKRRRRLYRALVDYFEEVLEERFETEKDSRPEEARQTALNYVRQLIRGSED